MKYLRYKGEFLSVAGITWRAEVWQEADSEFAIVGALEFDADEPLLIEWGKKSKEEVICGSTATIKIISPGDRTYEDLYSIEIGRVRMDIYRDSQLYWSGCIDTEFYEEPYEQLNGYTVSLSFTDLGVLDRLKYDLAGMQSIRNIVSYCLTRSGINYVGIDDSLISMSLAPNGGALSLHDINVRSDNFYDEDGEAKTLAEVITGILQPLSLRIVQRAGRVYVYDLNGLYTKAPQEVITWEGDSQTMGVDVVYNNAKITWNTYAQSGNLAPDKCWGKTKTDTALTSLNNLTGGQKGTATYHSYHYSTALEDWVDATDCGFTLWTSREGENAQLGNNVKFYKIVPQYDGTESEGIAIQWRAVAGEKTHNSTNFSSLAHGNIGIAGTRDKVGELLFKSSPVWLPPVDNPDGLLVRVTADVLLDPRFNPFEEAVNLAKYTEQKDWYDLYNRYANFVYVPVMIKYKPDNSDTVYVWTNQDIVWRPAYSYPVRTLNATYGRWVPYNGDTNPNAWGYLAYYDAKDRRSVSGVLGWKKNRPAINAHPAKTVSILTNAEAGQYIPFPNYGTGGGKLWVEVRAGWVVDYSGLYIDVTTEQITREILAHASWVLMGLPEIEIMNSGQFDKTVSTEDVEYNAEINGSAKEPIEIDTICGTSVEGVPTARGAYFNASTGRQITALTRAGRTTQAEDLLIGTLYSQFAQRRTSISGEARLMHTPITTYTEANQVGKLFIAVEDVQDTRMDISEAIYIELRPDEYRRRNE